MSNDYWKKRQREEVQYRQQLLQDDEKYNKELKTLYSQAILDINDTIEKELNRAGKDQVTSMDVEQYQTKAASIVTEAEKMRQAGHEVVYKDFSKEVNERLRVYNATMRINRLEHLKSEVGLDMLRAGIKIDSSMRDKLAGDYQKECIRQAGILMDSARHSSWTSKEMAEIVLAQTKGVTFSERLWADNDVLKAKLDQVLITGMVQGQNPRVMARRLKSQVKSTVEGQEYVAERLARTESARIQNTVAYRRIKDKGFRFVVWIAEIAACKQCQAIADKDNGHGKGVYEIDKVPRIPDDTHSNCRCGISVADVPENFDDESSTSNNEARIAKSINRHRQKQIKRPSLSKDPQVIQQRYNRAVKQYERETGIDVVKLMRDGKFADKAKPYDDEKAKFVKWLMRNNGYSGVPRPVDHYSGQTVYRGVHDSESQAATELIKNLKTTPYMISGADSSSKGRGSYFAELEFQARMHAGYGSNSQVTKWGMQRDAKILDIEEVKLLLSKIEGLIDRNTDMDYNYEIIGILGGYDIIKMGGTINVLNGGVIEWLKSTK